MWGVIITQPVHVAGVVLIIEDSNKDVISLGLYNQITRQRKNELIQLFPVGMIIGIKQPYLSLSYTGVVSLRNDNPENIMFKIEHRVRGSVPTGLYSEKYKNIGNAFFKKQEFLSAIRCYKQALKLS